MKIIKSLVFTFITVGVVSMILPIVDTFFQPFLQENLRLFFIVTSMVTLSLGFLFYVGAYLGFFTIEIGSGFSYWEKFFYDGKFGLLFGEIQVDSTKDKNYEVFYNKPYSRPPSLVIRQRSGSYEIIEQRTDGFKIQGHDIYNRIYWRADGEFGSLDTHVNSSFSSFSYSIFGAPNTKYTYDLFMLMPFTTSLKPVYDDHIKKIAKAQNLTIARADDFFSQNSIMYEVWSAITQAAILIADCTGKNPNVFYEIGIAHTLGKPVILITQNQDDVPFDLRHIRYIHYEYTPSGMIKFENTLTATISEIMKDLNTGKK